MAKASELKRGMLVEIDHVPHIVRQVEARSPSSRGAATLYKVRFTNLTTGQKLDSSLKGDDLLEDAHAERAEVQFSYIEDGALVFMRTDDYRQYHVDRASLEMQLPYLYEGQDGLTALIADDALLTIELPNSVVLEVVETAPGIKGASASGRTKPARLSTGLDIQVPEYLGVGAMIKVHTDTGKFISRAT